MRATRGSRGRLVFGRGFRLPGYLNAILAAAENGSCVDLAERRGYGFDRNDVAMLGAYGLMEQRIVEGRVEACLTSAGRELVEYIRILLGC